MDSCLIFDGLFFVSNQANAEKPRDIPLEEEENKQNTAGEETKEGKFLWNLDYRRFGACTQSRNDYSYS